MKKFLFIMTLCSTLIMKSQTLLNENFNDIGSLTSQGWSIYNASQPLGQLSWMIGSVPFFSAYNGTATSYIAVNFESTTNIGTISNWLITPTLNLKNGDIISFYSRDHHDDYADRLELRISQNGSASVLPSSSSSLGDFTTLALTINPNLLANGYPTVWTNYTYTITGLAQPTDCRIAFRYYVTDGGANGANSDYIGIDAVTVSATLNANDFEESFFNLSPNPTFDVLSITTDKTLDEIAIFSTLGEKVVEVKNDIKSLDISYLPKGVYVVKIRSRNLVSAKKIIKS